MGDPPGLWGENRRRRARITAPARGCSRRRARMFKMTSALNALGIGGFDRHFSINSTLIARRPSSKRAGNYSVSPDFDDWDIRSCERVIFSKSDRRSGL